MEIPQRVRILKANHCLKVHNAHFKSRYFANFEDLLRRINTINSLDESITNSSALKNLGFYGRNLHAYSIVFRRKLQV